MQKTAEKISTAGELTPAEIERYSRHLVIPEIGMEGQKKLKSASVLMIGAGGLGSPIGLYLAAAGVGKIGIVDFDSVSFSNLQRQVLYSTAEVGLPKAALAREKMLALNPEIEVEIFETKLTRDNALEIIKGYDVVADGSDNFASRYLVNDACVLLGKPFAYASILRFEGQVSFFNTAPQNVHGGPCYRCLYPTPPAKGEIPSCDEGGVLGVLPGIAGSIQANEIIKYITGKGKLLTGRLLLIDALNMKFKELKYEKDPDCPVCGVNPRITELIDYEEFCNVKNNNLNNTGKETMDKEEFSSETEISVEDYNQMIKDGKKHFLLDVRELFESQISSIGGHLIPLSELRDRVHELPEDKDTELIIYCRTGNRSYHAMLFLRQQGFTNSKNLAGGIYAWHDNIDPSVPKY